AEKNPGADSRPDAWQPKGPTPSPVRPLSLLPNPSTQEAQPIQASGPLVQGTERPRAASRWMYRRASRCSASGATCSEDLVHDRLSQLGSAGRSSEPGRLPG